MAEMVPVWEKANLTLEEAAAYFGIGINKLRDLTNEESCPFVLWNGSKRLIKRKAPGSERPYSENRREPPERRSLYVSLYRHPKAAQIHLCQVTGGAAPEGGRDPEGPGGRDRLCRRGDDSTRTCHPVYGSEAHPEGKLLSRL